MSRKVWVVILLIFLIGLIVVKKTPSSTEDIESSAAPDFTAPSPVVPVDTPALPTTVSALAADEVKKIVAAQKIKTEGVGKSATDNELVKALKVSLPENELLRNEVASNPHATPNSLIRFSVEVAQKMELALASETSSKILFQQLEACVTKSDGAHSAQAVCLINAKRIAKKYKDLRSDYDSLIRKADPEVVSQIRILK